MTAWTNEQDSILCSKHADGASFREISQCTGRTRNACIGRAHRLHLEVRITPEIMEKRAETRRQQAVARGAASRWNKPYTAKIKINPPPDPVSKLKFLCIPLLELQPQHCRYPHGENGKITFCGQPKSNPDTSSYCAFHRIVCTDLQRTRTSRNNDKNSNLNYRLATGRIA